MPNIKIDYDGSFPNLCSGQLVVTIEGFTWVFPDHCLSSGGNVWFDDDWCEHVESGEWRIREWPEGFPEDLKKLVESTVNDEISPGCCGGCV